MPIKAYCALCSLKSDVESIFAAKTEILWWDDRLGAVVTVPVCMIHEATVRLACMSVKSATGADFVLPAGPITTAKGPMVGSIWPLKAGETIH